MVMQVVRLTKKICDDFVQKKHYSRKSSIFWAGFGIVEEGQVTGVVVYGQPSPPIQKHAFRDRDFRLYELSRLVIQSKTRNAASFLIANSLKLLQSPCAVISYADTEYSHCGIVYQATNWLYTGLVKAHEKIYLVDGERVHSLTLRDRGITDPVRWAKENNIQTLPQSYKHRYFQFVGDRRQKKHMASKLAYEVLPDYPKCDQNRYDDGEALIISIEGISVEMQPTLF